MKKKITQIILALVLFIISLIFNFDNKWINVSLYIISYLIVGLEIVLKALKNILRGKVFDENFLMTVATLGAFCIKEFPEAVAVMLFYQIGETFQDFAVDKSRKSITELMDIRPDYANLKSENEVKKVDPEEVNIGDVIIVKPGETIPLDGIVIDGSSLLNTSALTGESIPREVNKNDEVISGCINQNGLLTIRVIKVFGESTVSKILDLVENSSTKKSNSENFITKFSKYYTPIVVILALLIAIVPTLLIKDTTFNEWLYRALSFLVISCPCALVISIPLSFFGGIGGASKQGILIKGSNYLEALTQADTIVLDKTGTLTEGVFEVEEIFPINISEDELLHLAVHAENFSIHPISLSLKKVYNGIINEDLISDTQEIAGHGILAKVSNKNILIGNTKLMNRNNIEFTEINKIGTILYIAIDNVYSGYILVNDRIKKDSFTAISELKNNGIKKTIMLTGDKKAIGEKVSNDLKLDMVYSELLPNEKVEIVENLLNQKIHNKKLVFVGDGINDAPVIALSDIGIAMGGLGSDAAIEASDIVIMTDEPSKIVTALKISRKTLRIVKQNIIFAIAVKIGVLSLSAFGISTMWEAVFADVGVSVLAILNALRLLNTGKKDI